MKENVPDQPSSQCQHDRTVTLISAYIAFLVTVMIAVGADRNHFDQARWIIGLAAVSLPSLVALILLDFIVRVRQSRGVSATRGLALALGMIPSLVALFLVLYSFSGLAAGVFAFLVLFWMSAIPVVVQDAKPGSTM